MTEALTQASWRAMDDTTDGTMDDTMVTTMDDTSLVACDGVERSVETAVVGAFVLSPSAAAPSLLRLFAGTRRRLR